MKRRHIGSQPTHAENSVASEIFNVLVEANFLVLKQM